jgi:hypothetical protein
MNFDQTFQTKLAKAIDAEKMLITNAQSAVCIAFPSELARCSGVSRHHAEDCDIVVRTRKGVFQGEQQYTRAVSV